MSFWTDFTTALSGFVRAAEADISKIATAIKPVIEASAEEVAQVALQSVLTQATSVLSGQEKLTQATSNVVNTLAASGKSVLIATAQAAVQTTYNTLSAQLNAKTN